MELDTKGCARKSWWDGVKEDMNSFGMSWVHRLGTGGEQKLRGIWLTQVYWKIAVETVCMCVCVCACMC